MSDERSDPTGRQDTDEALVVERRITDEGLERWRDAHADDAVQDGNGQTRRSSAIVPAWINWTMIVLVILWMAVITQQVIASTNQLSDINQRQIAAVQAQNDAQLCAQADIVDAVKKIGSKLGLPVDDIIPPAVEGIDCP